MILLGIRSELAVLVVSGMEKRSLSPTEIILLHTTLLAPKKPFSTFTVFLEQFTVIFLGRCTLLLQWV